MNYRRSLIRSARTCLQTLAASLIGLPTASAVLDVGAIRQALVVALYVAALAFVVTLLQNLGEDLASLEQLKG